MAVLLTSQRAEQWRRPEWSLVERCGGRALRPDQLRQLTYPRDVLVAKVPDQRELAVVAQYPCDLGQCDRRVEPVVRLCRDDAVERARTKRQPFGARLDDVHGQSPGHVVEHRPRDVGGDDTMTALREGRRQRAGAAAEFEHLRAGAGREPRDRTVGISG